MSTLFYYKLPFNLSAIYYYVYIVLLQTPLRAICQQYITMSTLFYYKLPLEKSVSNILLCLHCSITNSPQSNLSAIYYYVYIVLLQTPLRAICQQYITMSTLFYYKLSLEKSVSNISVTLSYYKLPFNQQYITMSTLFYYKLPSEQSVSNILLCLHCSITNSPSICQLLWVLLQIPLQSVSNILLCLHCSITNSS